MCSDREVLFFLQNIRGFGERTIRRLWEQFHTGNAIYRATEKDLEGLLTQGQKRTFLLEREKKNPAEALTQMEKKGIGYYSIFDSEYPVRLKKTEDFPLALYVKGRLPSEDKMTASVVGARNHTYYGEKQTRIFAGLLAREQVELISGMARGIDSIAQWTALCEGGSTFAVLGCGVDICYPQEARNLYDRLPKCGGIISEYPPGTQPKAGLFPRRNRIISALGDILLVMEAREKSGSLITVDSALEQGKEIWALPGRCDDSLSKGCNRLIAQGAGILTGEAEFQGELEILKQKYGQQPKEGKSNTGKGKSPAKAQIGSLLQNAILDSVDYNPLSAESVFERLNHRGILENNKERISLQEVNAGLIDLCLQGLVKQINGSWYIRV